MNKQTDTDINGLAHARQLIELEAAALKNMAEVLDDNFTKACARILACQGTVVLTGMGKAGLIAQKISSTLTSTGTPSTFLHPAEAIHGDLGVLRCNDLVIALSYSGASEEIVRLIGLVKQLDVPMIAITGKGDSPLAKHSDLTLNLGDLEEICPHGLAPSTSTTCMLAMGDAIAINVMQLRNFSSEDYARFHPGGSLGRQLVTVDQAALFTRGKPLPVAEDNLNLREAITAAEINTEMRHGCIMLIDDTGKLSGLITDGDLRRAMKTNGQAFLDQPVKTLMTKSPTVVQPTTLAAEAMAILHKHRIDELPVVDEKGYPVGLIDIQDVLSLKVLQ